MLNCTLVTDALTLMGHFTGINLKLICSYTLQESLIYEQLCKTCRLCFASVCIATSYFLVPLFTVWRTGLIHRLPWKVKIVYYYYWRLLNTKFWTWKWKRNMEEGKWDQDRNRLWKMSHRTKNMGKNWEVAVWR